ncbi:unnamed protein product [Nippostrongylus brasiliensis]|uniref:FAD_binding_8 domain-containing protein n=1 Tax=Nippostrongylus brasiliensis TaxID=27835 RepID=A0A0N4Y864_NIPBR|nr:unnamed protein product [Nippostrongylus brasiliensis]
MWAPIRDNSSTMWVPIRDNSSYRVLCRTLLELESYRNRPVEVIAAPEDSGQLVHYVGAHSRQLVHYVGPHSGQLVHDVDPDMGSGAASLATMEIESPMIGGFIYNFVLQLEKRKTRTVRVWAPPRRSEELPIRSISVIYPTFMLSIDS